MWQPVWSAGPASIAHADSDAGPDGHANRYFHTHANANPHSHIDTNGNANPNRHEHGSRVLDSIATHVRRLAPSGIPVAALELLAMQVVLTSQPLFDPRKAREWVKQYDIVDDKSIESAETVTKTPEETPALTESQKIRIKRSKADVAVADLRPAWQTG